VKGGLKKRGVAFDVDYLISLDEKRRAKIAEVDSLRAEQNTASDQVAGLSAGAREEKVAEMRTLKSKLGDIEFELETLETEFEELMRKIPNLPLDGVPEGDERSNVVLREVGEKPQFDFKPKDYLAIAEALDLIDMERAAKVTGSRFGYLKREAALLEFALIRYAFDILLPEGFIPIVPPVMLRAEHFRNIGRMPPGQEEERYFIPSDNLYLAGSAEHTIAPMHADEVLAGDALPLRYLAFSTCFRREAGSYGKDTKGILRVHQFDKVEMYSFVIAEDGEREHERLVGWQERLWQGLGLPYRVVLIAAGDLAWPEAKLYDIETWLPGQGMYRETHSASTTTDFQTRGVNTRYRRKDGSVALAHSLNATAIVIGRTIIAILENYQQADGSVRVPDALRPYMHGITEIRRT
jgi:seryl-tRNA synthetase